MRSFARGTKAALSGKFGRECAKRTFVLVREIVTGSMSQKRETLRFFTASRGAKEDVL